MGCLERVRFSESHTPKSPPQGLYHDLIIIMTIIIMTTIIMTIITTIIIMTMTMMMIIIILVTILINSPRILAALSGTVSSYS